MQFAAAVTRAEDIEEAARQLVTSLQRQMPGQIDLLTLFLTSEHRENASALADLLRHDLTPQALIGCTCEGVIGGDREIEREPGISVLAGRLPGVTLTSFYCGLEDWDYLLEDGQEARIGRRVGAVGPGKSETRAYLLLGDPFTTPITELIEALERLTPGIPIVGAWRAAQSARARMRCF